MNTLLPASSGFSQGCYEITDFRRRVLARCLAIFEWRPPSSDCLLVGTHPAYGTIAISRKRPIVFAGTVLLNGGASWNTVVVAEVAMRAHVCALSLACFVLGGCASNAYETRPFFQHEYRVEAHGRKTVFDHIVELDPGSFNVVVATDYLEHPPARIAVLPFADIGNANFVVDKIPLTFRNADERKNWAWTDSQRLRRALDGYLSQREFYVANIKGVDAVLRARGINTPEKLQRVSPAHLGSWLGVDAVVYGTVKNYEAYYFGLIAAWRVRVDVKVVSVHTGETLIRAAGSRYDTNLLIALTLEDIAISSGENLLQLRDINLARSEEETCREIVHRIPRSAKLEARIEKAALDYAEDPSHQNEHVELPRPVP